LFDKNEEVVTNSTMSLNGIVLPSELVSVILSFIKPHYPIVYSNQNLLRVGTDFKRITFTISPKEEILRTIDPRAPMYRAYANNSAIYTLRSLHSEREFIRMPMEVTYKCHRNVNGKKCTCSIL
jgi:hypothetical protein